MNEKLQYAEMLNIPVNTSTVTYKSKKRSVFKRKKDAEKLKEEVIAKVNSDSDGENAPELSRSEADIQSATQSAEISEVSPSEDNSDIEIPSFPDNYTPTTSVIKGKKKKREFKVNIIGIQLVIIGVLAAVICLTSALVPSSGINVFFKEVFGSESVKVDDRKYDEFSAVIPASSANLTVENGIMTITGNSAVYSPCDGTVSSLTLDKETKKYDITITHNENFKTVIKGVDYAYAEIGGAVFSNVPVGYVKESATLCFTDGNDAVITDYGIAGGSVVWAV